MKHKKHRRSARAARSKLKSMSMRGKFLMLQREEKRLEKIMKSMSFHEKHHGSPRLLKILKRLNWIDVEIQRVMEGRSRAWARRYV